MRKAPEQIEVREQGYFEPPYFKLYNHIHERYARRVGFQAWGVYCTLKQFVDWKTEWNSPRATSCTVSLDRIAITWGVTKRTVKRAIRKLRDFGLIRVKKNQASSTYTIMKVKVPKSRGDRFVPSEVTKTSLQRGQQRPIDQTLFTKPSLPGGKHVDASSKGKHPRRGNDGPPPKWSQSDFDERDYRKWRKEFQEIRKTSSASVGSNIRPSDPEELAEWEAEQDEIWISDARTAAARAGILPRRIVEILKQVNPEDPNVPKIDQRRKKA